uniref:Putative defensin n=1 Tax=Ixodes scapularis TaxID=6945 RepID=A0A4D5RNS9_IXOSC
MSALRLSRLLVLLVAVSVASGRVHVDHNEGQPTYGCPFNDMLCQSHCQEDGYLYGECTDALLSTCMCR